MTWNLRSLRVRAAASGRGRLPAGHRQPQELIITGISRSGTSYLCSLLHRFDDCVAVNEPLEAIRLLRLEAKPVGLRTFYRDLRRDILAGRPIVNKLLDGEVVEDTAVSQRRRRYQPQVASADFVLAIKNTREFLSRLDAIREVMPSARVAACVRNPFDTIASWKGSFHHLRDADVQQFLGGSGAWLSERHRATLVAIGRLAEHSRRRAR